MTDFVQDAGVPAADPERLRRHVAELARGPRSRRHAPAAMARAEAYVARELTLAGWHVEREPFRVRWHIGSPDGAGRRSRIPKVRLHRELAGANLRAVPPHLDPRPGDATVVVGAHLDTVCGSPGADDNASGVAALLEVARLLGSRRRPPDVTLMVFDHEETGLVGSSVAARRLVRSRRVAGMVCLESVGYFDTAPGSQRVPHGAGFALPGAVAELERTGYRGDFTLVVHRRSSLDAARVWRDAARAATPSLPSVLLRDPRADGRIGAALGYAVPVLYNLSRSDHAPFWTRHVPALLLTGTAEFRNARYHRPTDIPDTLDYGRLAAVAAATSATALGWPRP